MAKTKENAGSSKAAAKAKRASAKAKKTRAAKDAAAVKAVLDAEAARESEGKPNRSGKKARYRAAMDAAAERLEAAVAAQADGVAENADAVAESADPVVEDADPVADEAPKRKRTQGRQKGYNTAKAEIERQERIKETMEYRLIGYTYRQIAEQMNVAPSTAYKWVAEGLAEITQETAEELRRVMFEQCHQIVQKLMPLVDETAPRDVIDSILKVQDRQMKLAGMLQGAGVSINIGKPGEGDSDEDIVVRIKADAPVLRPDEPVPARPVL